MGRSYVLLSNLKTISTIWMIGHSNHPLDRFLEILQQHEIRSILDIRTSPRSRFPRFNKSALAAALCTNGISYSHAPRLGGRDPIPNVDLVRELGVYLPPSARTCLMCSEGDPHKCHRHTIIAPLLKQLGYVVRQILPDGTEQEES